jgi:hypothetical protein
VRAKYIGEDRLRLGFATAKSTLDTEVETTL